MIEGLARGLYRLVDVGLAAFRNFGQRFLVCGVDSRKGFARFGRHPFTADQEVFGPPEELSHSGTPGLSDCSFDRYRCCHRLTPPGELVFGCYMSDAGSVAQK